MEIADLLKMLGNPTVLQQQFKEAQERLAHVTVTGTAGGNMASVTLNGKMEITNVNLAPEVFSSGDVSIVQDLFKAAYNDAQAKLNETMKDMFPTNLSGMPGSFNPSDITNMFNNFFKQ